MAAPESRAVLIAMAQQWLALAERAEKSDKAGVAAPIASTSHRQRGKGTVPVVANVGFEDTTGTVPFGEETQGSSTN